MHLLLQFISSQGALKQRANTWGRRGRENVKNHHPSVWPAHALVNGILGWKVLFQIFHF